MVGPSGLEPPTSRLSGVRSNQLSYGPFMMERVMGIEPTRPAWKAGVLPLNYTRMKFLWSGRQDSNLRPSGPKPDALPSCATSRNGVPGETRTPNLLIRSQTLYPIELRALNI